MTPVHLLIVQVAEESIETSVTRDVLIRVAADVPLSDHMRLVARILHVLGHNLVFIGNASTIHQKKQTLKCSNVSTS